VIQVQYVVYLSCWTPDTLPPKCHIHAKLCCCVGVGKSAVLTFSCMAN